MIVNTSRRNQTQLKWTHIRAVQTVMKLAPWGRLVMWSAGIMDWQYLEPEWIGKIYANLESGYEMGNIRILNKYWRRTVSAIIFKRLSGKCLSEVLPEDLHHTLAKSTKLV
jgi:hypothetical protein